MCYAYNTIKGAAGPARGRDFLERGKRLRRAVRALVSLELGVYAANASFFILLSLFPGMLLLIGVLQYTPLTPADLEDSLQALLPEALQPLLDYMIRELFVQSAAGLLPVSAVMALWTASKGAHSLLLGLNRVYRLRESRGYLLVRLRCAAFTVLLLLALLLTAALDLFGRHLSIRLAQSALPALQLAARLLQIKYWIMTLLLGLFFTFVYAVLPNHRVRAARMLPGAFLAAVGWEVFSGLFSYYVNQFGNYSLYYGSLSVIAITMLWLYVCIGIVFLGALLNHAMFAKSSQKGLDKLW